MKVLKKFSLVLGLVASFGTAIIGHVPKAFAMSTFSSPPFDYYTISQGDSLNFISQRYGVSLQSLLELNPGINPMNLIPGRSVRLRGSLPAYQVKANTIIQDGLSHWGDPYVYGAQRYFWLADDGTVYMNPQFDPHKFDCSSFLQYLYLKDAGVKLHGTSQDQFTHDGYAIPLSDVRAGDLMFFYNSTTEANTGAAKVGHVAMVKQVNSDGSIVLLHTYSSRVGVATTTMVKGKYWWNTFIEAKRVLN